jgi:hypothetical protein
MALSVFWYLRHPGLQHSFGIRHPGLLLGRPACAGLQYTNIYDVIYQDSLLPVMISIIIGLAAPSPYSG